MMYCQGTDVTALAATVKQCIDTLAQETDLPVYQAHIYLMPVQLHAGGGHDHYSVETDTSYGGDPAAVDAVRAVLPMQLYHVEYDTAAYDDAAAAFDAAYADTF